MYARHPMMARKPAKCLENLTKSVGGGANTCLANGNSKLKRTITVKNNPIKNPKLFVYAYLSL